MVCSTYSAFRTQVVSVPTLQHKHLKVKTAPNLLGPSNHLNRTPRPLYIRHASTSPWEPSPTRYAPDAETKSLKQTGNIFETMASSDEPLITDTEQLTDAVNQPVSQFQFLKWPLWLLGPCVLLATGVAPTLWLPLSSLSVGPNIATLLALTGLDCIYNIGATLFLLMADNTARPNNNIPNISSKPPPSYRFWNLFANILGFIIPLATLYGAQNGFLNPPLPFISFLVLLGPYFLLLGVQLLTEMLTWHGGSPVWLVTPVVYEAYRLVQLMRGLKLGVELGAPSWTVHTIRVLVCGWVLVLGVQLMRVAWYAGFSARASKDNSPTAA